MIVVGPTCIEDSDIGRAWAQAFLALQQPGVREIASLVVSITGFRNGDPHEDAAIRQAVDQSLAAAGKKRVDAVANTIFPLSKWDPALPAQTLYDGYLGRYAHLKKSYFNRMIAYCPRGDRAPVNQLQHVIATWKKGNHRRSALQLPIFDPTRDHTDQRRRGFPCLNQIALSPQSDGGLHVTGFYATQLIFSRAYGNYLGLARLGKFLAHEMNLELTRVTCMTNVAQLGVSKTACRDLAKQLATIWRKTMEEEVRTSEVTTTTRLQSTTPPASQDAEQTTAQAVPQDDRAESQDDPQRPEMLVSEEEVDQNVIASNKSCRHATHESGRWLREKKRRLVGRGRDGDWEPWLRSPEIDIPLSTANDRIRRFEEREGLRPIFEKVPDSGTFQNAGEATLEKQPTDAGGPPTGSGTSSLTAASKQMKRQRTGYVDRTELEKKKEQVAAAPVRVILVYSRTELDAFNGYTTALFQPFRQMFPDVDDANRLTSLIVLEALRRAYSERETNAA